MNSSDVTRDTDLRLVRKIEFRENDPVEIQVQKDKAKLDRKPISWDSIFTYVAIYTVMGVLFAILVWGTLSSASAADEQRRAAEQRRQAAYEQDEQRRERTERILREIQRR